MMEGINWGRGGLRVVMGNVVGLSLVIYFDFVLSLSSFFLIVEINKIDIMY